MSKKKLILGLVMLAVALALPYLIAARYYQHMLIMVLIWAAFGTAWDLLGGHTGQVSYGHAAFFGVGAYAAGLVAFHWQISAWWGMLLGPLAAVAVAVPIGLISFRLRGPYFSLAMLATGEIFRLVFTNWTKLTNGSQGILIMPTLSGKISYYYIGLAILILSILMVFFLMHSRYGYYFNAIREDQDAAEALGIPTAKFKMYALLPSAFLTGLIGAFYMNYVCFIDPQVVFSLSEISIMVVLVVMLGGTTSTWGPTIGAGLYVMLSEMFRTWWGSASVLGFGILVCLVILFLPNGIAKAPAAIRGLLAKKNKQGRWKGWNFSK